jgi:hypothetical protein
MQAIQKVEALVYIFDHRSVDFFLDVPEFLKFDKLLPSVLEKYVPPFTARISNVAFTVCHHAYLKDNPEGTLEDFQTKFLTTPAGITAYQEALALVSSKVKKVLTVEDIQGMCVKRNAEPPADTNS